MAISFADSTGNIMNRIKAIGEAIDDINTWRGSGGALETLINAVQAQYASADRELINNLYVQLDTARSSLNTLVQFLSNLMANTVIKMADNDVSLVQKTLQVAMAEVIYQATGLDDASGTLANPADDIDAPAVTATVTANSNNTGDADIVASVRRLDGRTSEYALAETVEVICTKDSYSGGVTEGSGEQWSVKGEVSSTSRFAYDWPQGSGASITLSSVDAASENSTSTNLLANSDFEDFDDTANVPDEWTLSIGAAGTNCLEETTTKYHGSSALEFVGDASNTETRLVQTFKYGTSNGNNSSELKPNTVYHFSCRVGKGASISAGTWKVGLAYSSGTYLTSDNGTECSATIAHGSIATAGSWTKFSGVFVTPKVITSRPQFMIETPNGADISDGHSLFMDHLTLVEAKQTYKGGPWVSAHSGNTATLLGDKYNAAIANNYAGAIQKHLHLALNMPALGGTDGLQFPSDSGGSETIADWS